MSWIDKLQLALFTLVLIGLCCICVMMTEIHGSYTVTINFGEQPVSQITLLANAMGNVKP